MPTSELDLSSGWGRRGDVTARRFYPRLVFDDRFAEDAASIHESDPTTQPNLSSQTAPILGDGGWGGVRSACADGGNCRCLHGFNRRPPFSAGSVGSLYEFRSSAKLARTGSRTPNLGPEASTCCRHRRALIQSFSQTCPQKSCRNAECWIVTCWMVNPPLECIIAIGGCPRLTIDVCSLNFRCPPMQAQDRWPAYILRTDL